MRHQGDRQSPQKEEPVPRRNDEVVVIQVFFLKSRNVGSDAMSVRHARLRLGDGGKAFVLILAKWVRDDLLSKLFREPLLVAALRDLEVQIVYLDQGLPDSVDDNDNSDKDDDNDGVGIDEDNNDDDEAGEYVNTSRLCERTAGCLLHS